MNVANFLRFYWIISILILKETISMMIQPTRRQTKKVELQPKQIGVSTTLTFHEYNVPSDIENRNNTNSNTFKKTAYIQATLHVDEIPGLLVNHHLIKLLVHFVHGICSSNIYIHQ